MLSDNIVSHLLNTGEWKVSQTRRGNDGWTRIAHGLGEEDLVLGPNSIDVTLGYYVTLQPGMAYTEGCDEKGEYIRIWKEPRDPISWLLQAIPYLNRCNFLHRRRSHLEADLLKYDSAASKENIYIRSGVRVIIMPGAVTLSIVREAINCNNSAYGDLFVQRYNGRSTLGRMFLQSHMTAGEGDYGFSGAFVLEIKNSGGQPISLRPEQRVGQVYFEKVHDYKLGCSKYHGYDHMEKPAAARTGAGRG